MIHRGFFLEHVGLAHARTLCDRVLPLSVVTAVDSEVTCQNCLRAMSEEVADLEWAGREMIAIDRRN